MGNDKTKGFKELWHSDMNLFKTVIITGFFKSTIGTGLIALGISIIFNGLVNPGWNSNFPYLGAIAILIGVIVYFLGDIYKKDREKENVNIIQDKTERYVQDESERIKSHIHKIIAEEEEKKERTIKKRLELLEHGMCTDLEEENPTIKKYCQGRNTDITLLNYPEGYPTQEIVNIGRTKALFKGEEPTTLWLETYLKVLYNASLITMKQLKECLKLIGGDDIWQNSDYK